MGSYRCKVSDTKTLTLIIFFFLINNETCEWGRVSFFVAFSPLYLLFYGPLTCLAFLTITIFTYMTKQLPNIQRGKRSLFPVRSVHFLPVNRQAFIIISLELHNILQQVINKLKVMGSSVIESKREVWFLSPCCEELRCCSLYLQRLSSLLLLNLIPEPLPPSTLPKNLFCWWFISKPLLQGTAVQSIQSCCPPGFDPLRWSLQTKGL